MLKLTVVSVDNLNFEHECLEFYYGKTLMFAQYGKSLNRGGRGFNLKSLSTGTIVTSSGHQHLKVWLKEVTKTLNSLGFEISAEEVLEAIKARRLQNIHENNAEVEHQIQTERRIIKDLQKRIMDCEKEIAKLKKQLVE